MKRGLEDKRRSRRALFKILSLMKHLSREDRRYLIYCQAEKEYQADRLAEFEPEGCHDQELGAAKGGKARAESLSGERRSEIARAAAQARWKK